MAKKAVLEKEETKTSELHKLCEGMNKKYGSGTVIGAREAKEDLEVVSSGSVGLDIATDIGGIPVGKLVEIYGPESSGKTTVTLHIIAEFQKAGKKCVLIDGEQSFDKKYARKLGVRIADHAETETDDDLLISQPRTMEDAYNIAEDFASSGLIGLIVVDSQTALVPKKALEGEIGDAKMAFQARINSEALQKIHPLLQPNNCTMIAISQLRVNIGGYGDPNVPTGGYAYKFYSDMRLKVAKQISKETESNKTTVTVIKNKCGVPFGEAVFAINWGTGIDRTGEIVTLGIEKKIITVSGSWYQYKDQKIQGEEKVKEYLNSNPEELKELQKLVL